MSIVQRIRELCEERGLTLNQLEKASGLRGTIARWEDHDPGLDKVRKVAEVLGVTVSDLLEENKSPADDDGEMMELFQTLRERPDMRLLFDAGRRATPETVRKTARLLEEFSKDDNSD